MTQKEKQIILIAGVHRSGTSMVARLLNLHGAHLPLELQYSDEYNEKGYWESFEVQRLNDELLRLGDSSWFDIRAFSLEKQPVERVEELRQKFRGFIEKIIDEAHYTPVIKDPRICRVVPFWRELLTESGVQPRVLIPFRNPLEVASSIKHRDGFSTSYCLSLWLRNVLEAEVATRGTNRVFCSYSEMLSDWPGVFLKIQNRLHLSDLLPFSEVQHEIDEFVTGSLKHWANSEADLKAYMGPDSLPFRAFQLLKQAEQGGGQALQTGFDTLLDQLNRTSTIEEELENRNRKVVAFQKMLSAAFDAKQGELESVNSELEVANQRLADSESRQSRLQRELTDQAATIEALGDTLSWRMTAPLRLAFDWMVLYPLHLIKKINRSSPKTQNPVIDSEARNRSHALINDEAHERRFVARTEETSPLSISARLIAFYLPQFHPIPENDRWWGKGFTEWTNVKKAKPLYPLHHQPRIPGDLGYYDLRDVEVQRKQVGLAKQYGLSGFCFYFYWFHGKRLLETPVLNYLENKDLDLPFCLCWANENWTRTWDGEDRHVLIGQDHSEEDDLAFIEYLSKYLNDERYIRVAGKPLILVYRPSLLPDAAITAGRWRGWCQENGIGEIYLAYTQSFEKVHPDEIGFDAAIEFPPNNTGPEIITDQVDDLPFSFKGFVYDWTSIASRSETYVIPEYTLFRGVNPSWDNTSRRRETGAVFAGNTPSMYQRWLENAITDTKQRFEDESERLIFINAWNEWAEGAYLEPDAAHGYAYLQATRNALENSFSEQAQAERTDHKIILVAHDGHPHGAQYLMLYTARCLNRYFRFQVDLVVLGEGILIDEFKKWATVHSLAGLDNRGNEAKTLARSLVSQGHTAAICNTTVSGLFLETLSNAGLRTVSLVHELSNVITDNQLEKHARSIAKNADNVVFAATQVMEPFLDIAPIPAGKTVIRFQGNYKKNKYLGKPKFARKMLRQKLGLSPDAKIVLGVGYLDHRKGIDLYVQAGLEVCERIPGARFVWIGHWEMHMEKQIHTILEKHPLGERIIFPGRQDDTDLFFAGSDVFALTSREDPFPTTVMEALEVSTPVVGFAGAGGSEDLIQQGCGVIVPMENVSALADALEKLIVDRALSEKMGEKGARIVHRDFSFPHYVFDLLELAGKPLPRVSVVVPNYNYERHLEQRLRSIFEQTFPIYELIVLDDVSTDGSVKLVERLLSESEIHNKLVVNKKNSGSVFKQWSKGVEMASGNLVWICEADDFAAPEFLEKCIEKMRDEEVVLSFTQSCQVNEQGKILESDYLNYTSDICHQKWVSDYISDGLEEIKSSLSIKNTIPNASAVVFRKNQLEQCLASNMAVLEKLKIAGDWLIYCELLPQGKVAYTAQALNFHRRHDESVTISANNNERHMAEIMFMQRRLSNKYTVDSITTQKAKEFADHAFRHLDLSSTEINRPEQHTGVNDWLVKIGV